MARVQVVVFVPLHRRIRLYPKFQQNKKRKRHFNSIETKHYLCFFRSDLVKEKQKLNIAIRKAVSTAGLMAVPKIATVMEKIAVEVKVSNNEANAFTAYISCHLCSQRITVTKGETVKYWIPSNLYGILKGTTVKLIKSSRNQGQELHQVY